MDAPAAAPGWYDDRCTPDVVRWFDGAGWTEHTSPQPAPPPAYGQPAYGQPAYGQPAYGQPAYGQTHAMGAAPSDALHWILPLGRSWQSIVAGYVGLVALFVWPLAPVSIGLGVWALVRASQGGHGRGRAIFAIVAGSLGLMGLAISSIPGLRVF